MNPKAKNYAQKSVLIKNYLKMGADCMLRHLDESISLWYQGVKLPFTPLREKPLKAEVTRRARSFIRTRRNGAPEQAQDALGPI